MISLYRVSCPSDCGSYFAPYLKAVTVVASSRNQAVAMTVEYLAKHGRRFLYGQDKWKVYFVCDLTPGVVEAHEEADY